MAFVKGTDGIPRTVKNPLEGSVGNIDLNSVTVTTLSASSQISSSGNLTATGNISGGNLLGTVATASQTNITAVGILSSLSVSGNISGGNLLTGGIVGSSGNIQTSANVLAGVNIVATGNSSGNNINSITTVGLAVYANATVRDSSITSPRPGMMIYVTGTGMQVRGATAWNTVAGTST